MRTLWIGAVTLMMLVGLCGLAAAQPAVNETDPIGSIWWTVTSPEVFAYDVDANGNIMEGQARLARAWKTGGYQSYCNKDRCVDVQIYASVAQWLSLAIEGTDLHWRVLKPGTYAADGIGVQLASNGDVGLVFSGFDHLTSPTAPEGSEAQIETWYAYTSTGSPPPGHNDWVSAPDLNEAPVVLPELPQHGNYSFQLWNKINVVPCNSACWYSNEGTICFTLLDQKDWVDRETGDFKADYPAPDWRLE